VAGLPAFIPLKPQPNTPATQHELASVEVSFGQQKLTVTWPATEPMDMRAGTDIALARVVLAAESVISQGGLR
jgi:hypothetical protein